MVGAVQAQDFAAAKWALALRMKSARDADIERALESGRHLTREELASELARHGIEARGQKLAHIVMHAELDALICSGPLKGRQFTYALLEERVPKARRLTREESLATLALRYFQSHGPATLHDFAKWSGLSLTEAREAVALERKVREMQSDAGVYYRVRSTPSCAVPSPHALLLSIYDEHVIAYRDWDVLCEERGLKQRLFTQGNATPNVLLIDGRIAGTWRRSLTDREVRLTITPLRPLTSAERAVVDREVERYSELLGRPVSTAFTAPARGSRAQKRKGGA